MRGARRAAAGDGLAEHARRAARLRPASRGGRWRGGGSAGAAGRGGWSCAVNSRRSTREAPLAIAPPIVAPSIAPADIADAPP
jgi:hypothetical protein